jgi:hypothetical protein
MRLSATALTALVPLTLIACGSADEGSRSEPGETPVATAPSARGETLATLERDGHTFLFARSASGDLVVGEKMPLGDQPRLSHESVGSILDVYASLANGAPAPGALREASLELAQHLIAPTADVTPPPAPETPAPSLHARALAPMALTAGQSWFQQYICSQSTIQQCVLQNGPLNTSRAMWVNTPNYYSYAYYDSTNTSTANLLEYHWTGSAWANDFVSPTLQPGDYWSFLWWNTNPVYRSTAISGYGPEGLAMGGITPGFSASYTEFGGFTFHFGNFPNDQKVRISINGYRDTAVYEPNLSINVGLQGACSPGAYNPNAQAIVARGETTGQTATTYVNLGSFDPGRCGTLFTR